MMLSPVTQSQAAVQVRLSVGGKFVPVSGFEITGGAYGTVGHAQASCSVKLLAALQIDLYALTSSANGSVTVEIYVFTATRDAIKVFGGEHVKSSWHFDKDLITIEARDWSGLLVDQKRVTAASAQFIEQILDPLAIGKDPNAAGVNTENQKISALVTSIATLYGLTPVINLASDTKQGVQHGSGNVSFIPSPDNLWKILCELARDTGNIVYCTPDKQLVFGLPGAGLPVIPCTWDYTPTAGQLAVRNLQVDHHPRRNSTFRVLITSYDPARQATTLGRATAIGGNFSGTAGLASGIYGGNASKTADTKLRSYFTALHDRTGGSFSQIALYTFHYDGLTADQANAKAISVATDLAKREIIVSFESDMIIPLEPGQNVRFAAGPPMLNGLLYVSDYSHSFSLPQPGHAGDAGLLSKVTCLNLPTQNLASDGDAG